LAEADLKDTNQKGSLKLMALTAIAKCFAHGILFSTFFLVLTMLLGFVATFLVAIDFMLVVLIGFWLLCLIIGFANSVITSLLWFKVDMSFLGIMAHGFVLLIVWFIVNMIVVIVPSLVFPGIVTTVVTLIIGSFPNGLVGRLVAEWWR